MRQIHKETVEVTQIQASVRALCAVANFLRNKLTCAMHVMKSFTSSGCVKRASGRRVHGVQPTRTIDLSDCQAVRTVHGQSFLVEIAGVTLEDRFTSTPIYTLVHKELLSKSLHAKVTRQVPRMKTSMLAALELTVVDTKSTPSCRMYSWWTLLQTWAHCVFVDHQGLIPSDVTHTNNCLSAKLTRSKTIGEDRQVTFGPVHVFSCCFCMLSGSR